MNRGLSSVGPTYDHKCTCIDMCAYARFVKSQAKNNSHCCWRPELSACSASRLVHPWRCWLFAGVHPFSPLVRSTGPGRPRRPGYV